MDILNAARVPLAELQATIRRTNDPNLRAALEGVMRTRMEAAASKRRKLQGPVQTAAQDSSQQARARSQAQRGQGKAPRENRDTGTQRAFTTQTSLAASPVAPPEPEMMLGMDRERFRQAFILKEILGPPPSLQDDF